MVSSEHKDRMKKYYIENRERIKERSKQYYIENREEIRERAKQSYFENLKRIKEYKREWRIKNQGKEKERHKRYYIGNRQKILKESKQYYKDNPEKFREASKRWRKNNLEKAGESQKHYRNNNPNYIIRQRERMKRFKKNNPDYYNQYVKNRSKTDLKFNLNHKISRAVRDCLKGRESKAGRSWESLIGYTLADLVKRLNKTIPAGYTWQDFLSGKLHTDHIIPISAFNFTRPEHSDFKRCWALENLRLLPAKENIIKSNHLIRPFQPALKI